MGTHSVRAQRRHLVRLAAMDALRKELVVYIDKGIRTALMELFTDDQDLCVRLGHIFKSMAYHKKHNDIIGQAVHFAGAATSQARPALSQAEIMDARQAHKTAGAAKHNNLLSNMEGTKLQGAVTMPKKEVVINNASVMEHLHQLHDNHDDKEPMSHDAHLHAHEDVHSDEIDALPSDESGCLGNDANEDFLNCDLGSKHDVAEMDHDSSCAAHTEESIVERTGGVERDMSSSDCNKGLSKSDQECGELGQGFDHVVAPSIDLTADSPADLAGAPSLTAYLAPQCDAWRRLDELSAASVVSLIGMKHWAWCRPRTACSREVQVQIIRLGDRDYCGQVRIRMPGEPLGWSAGRWVSAATVIAQPAVLRPG